FHGQVDCRGIRCRHAQFPWLHGVVIGHSDSDLHYRHIPVHPVSGWNQRPRASQWLPLHAVTTGSWQRCCRVCAEGAATSQCCCVRAPGIRPIISSNTALFWIDNAGTKPGHMVCMRSTIENMRCMVDMILARVDFSTPSSPG